METLTQWWPVTYDFGAIESDLDTILPIRAKMYEDADLELETRWLSGSLDECFATLEPLSPAPYKELFLATRFGWTVFFSNGVRGSDPFLPMLQLSRAIGVTALRACATPASARYQAVILEVYNAPHAGGTKFGRRRTIAAANDGGRWVFEQSGAPFAFEDTARYDARKKRDRFTCDMLFSYLESLGVPRPSDDVLQSDGHCRGLLLSRTIRDNRLKYSLDEAKAL